MLKIAIGLRNWWSAVMIATVGVMFLPTPNVWALAPASTPAPAAPALIANARLEAIWARQQSIHDRLTMFFDGVDERIAQRQMRIDNANAKGKDVADLQGALDAFSDAVKRARPVFESTNGIVASHQGFDAGGKVTDTADAARSVIQLGEKYQEIRAALQEPMRALRDAMQAFRQTNFPVLSPTATP